MKKAENTGTALINRRTTRPKIRQVDLRDGGGEMRAFWSRFIKSGGFRDGVSVVAARRPPVPTIVDRRSGV